VENQHAQNGNRAEAINVRAVAFVVQGIHERLGERPTKKNIDCNAGC
jgi:hypothetical protein